MWATSLINQRYLDMRPRKRRVSLRFFGGAKFLIVATFSGSLLSLYLSTICPKYLSPARVGTRVWRNIISGIPLPTLLCVSGRLW